MSNLGAFKKKVNNVNFNNGNVYNDTPLLELLQGMNFKSILLEQDAFINLFNQLEYEYKIRYILSKWNYFFGNGKEEDIKKVVKVIETLTYRRGSGVPKMVYTQKNHRQLKAELLTAMQINLKNTNKTIQNLPGLLVRLKETGKFNLLNSISTKQLGLYENQKLQNLVNFKKEVSKNQYILLRNAGFRLNKVSVNTNDERMEGYVRMSQTNAAAQLVRNAKRMLPNNYEPAPFFVLVAHTIIDCLDMFVRDPLQNKIYVIYATYCFSRAIIYDGLHNNMRFMLQNTIDARGNKAFGDKHSEAKKLINYLSNVNESVLLDNKTQNQIKRAILKTRDTNKNRAMNTRCQHRHFQVGQMFHTPALSLGHSNMLLGTCQDIALSDWFFSQGVPKIIRPYLSHYNSKPLTNNDLRNENIYYEIFMNIVFMSLFRHIHEHPGLKGKKVPHLSVENTPKFMQYLKSMVKNKEALLYIYMTVKNATPILNKDALDVSILGRVNSNKTNSSFPLFRR